MSGAQNSFWAQRYPEGIIQTLEEREIPLKAFLARGINQEIMMQIAVFQEQD